MTHIYYNTPEYESSVDSLIINHVKGNRDITGDFLSLLPVKTIVSDL